MGPARLEMNCAFRLSQAAIESHGADHVPECVREFLRVVLFLQVSRRENESCVTDFKQSMASFADRGEGTELDEPANLTADGIKIYIDSQGGAPLIGAARYLLCRSMIAGRAGKRDQSTRNATDSWACNGERKGRELGAFGRRGSSLSNSKLVARHELPACDASLLEHQICGNVWKRYFRADKEQLSAAIYRRF